MVLASAVERYDKGGVVELGGGGSSNRSNRAMDTISDNHKIEIYF